MNVEMSTFGLIDTFFPKFDYLPRQKFPIWTGAFFPKTPEKALYHRWIFETEKDECVESLRDFVIRESEFHTIAAETIHGIGATHKSKQSKQSEKADRSYHSDVKSEKKAEVSSYNRKCQVCNNSHAIWDCAKFKALDIAGRWAKAKDLKLCFRCLKGNHQGSDCRNFRKCGLDGCTKVHNRLLHRCEEKPDVNSSQESTGSLLNPEASVFQSDNFTAYSKSPNYVALRTVPVILKSGKKSVKVNALLDDGSTKTYINADIASNLGLSGQVKSVSVNVLDGQVRTFETMPVNLTLESVDGNSQFEISAFTTNRVTGNLKVLDWNEESKHFPHLQGIHFPRVNTSRPIIDILIGVDHPDIHRSITEIYGRPGEPYARLGPLGWTCIGKPYSESSLVSYFIEGDIENLLRGFWEIETQGTMNLSEPLSHLNQKTMHDTVASFKYKNGRYEVGIPWKETPVLPNNYEMALNRLKGTEKKLNKMPFVKQEYQATIEKYIQKGYIRKVSSEENTHTEIQKKWYLPHFPVIRLDKDSTKVRIVFDASAKIRGVSLNDFIHEGPKLQNELFNVLLRFRKHPIAILCDISEMYLQIQLKQEDRPFHRFLWKSEINPPEEYEFNRVVFGVNASPFLAMFVSRKNAELYQKDFPLAAETVLLSTYMDDSMDSVSDEVTGIQLYTELSALWEKAGMFAKKWLSNSTAVMEQIPLEDRAKEVDLNSGHLPTKKTLGVMWQAEEDVFTFKVHLDVSSDVYTKRLVLKTIAKLFDPIGLLSPFIIQGKIILQKIWCEGYDWDEPIESDLRLNIVKWFSELPDLNDTKVERTLNFSKEVTSSTVHVFVDASELAYAAVIYIRHKVNDSSIEIHFVCSKTKVAPLKAISIPRLELMGALLGARLAKTVVQALKVDMNQVLFWTDSMNVLWWIHRESRCFKPFVANRVGEIHEISLPNQWRYVPSPDNPADIASRGMAANKLVNSTVWWYGPEFLRFSPESWPEKVINEHEVTKSEIRQKSSHVEKINVFHSISITDELMKPERFSNWLRLVRVFGWVLRFVENVRCKAERRKQNELQKDEITNAEVTLIHKAQLENYPEEYTCLLKGTNLKRNSKLLHLNPMIDKDGLIRSDSRLKNADFLAYDAKFPIILPRKSWITKLIVKHFHELNYHSGTNQVLSSLSARYWIEAAREVIRQWEKECSFCKLRRNKPSTQIMAPLPELRLKMPLRAFSHTAVDYAGPFITIQGRGKRREKRYLCLFTCMACRAVHLEMAYGLDTNSFLNAFYRFASRRGLPVLMNSDNGSNFVSADRELKELVQALDTDYIVRKTADKGIRWEFNPPNAPHFGGVHEAMIKAAKRAVCKILQKADITDEELSTAFVGAEGLMNSRPLTYQSSNPSDDVVLTPNHFLHGQAGGEFAPSSIDTTVFDPRKRWRYVQELVKHFWRRWIREFLPTLGSRKKWFQTKRDFKVDDVVVVIDVENPRGHWPLGRIVEVFPGADGHVRVVKVRVGSNILKRPITKLCLLEQSDP